MAQLAETLSNNFEQDGHKVYRLSLGSGKTGILSFFYLYIYFLVIIPQYDIIHIISASGKSLWLKDLPAIILARLFRQMVVLNFVGGMAIDHFSEWPWIKRVPFRCANTVIVPTNILKEKIETDEIGVTIHVIPHVVDIEPFQKVKKDKKSRVPILLAAKALVPYAGFDLLLDIFIRVKKKIPDVQLWIAGSGPTQQDLEFKVKNMNIKGVTFLGNVPHDDMPGLMRKSTVFVHGSRYESFGIVLVEAMASGLPVVAFNIGGITDVVVDNVTGYLVNYGDINTFAMKIIKLIENKENIEVFTTNAIKHSDLFYWPKIRLAWYKIYNQS
jgi:glycosyltransferase involved in cell wall biosynthesis